MFVLGTFSFLVPLVLVFTNRSPYSHQESIDTWFALQVISGLFLMVSSMFGSTFVEMNQHNTRKEAHAWSVWIIPFLLIGITTALFVAIPNAQILSRDPSTLIAQIFFFLSLITTGLMVRSAHTATTLSSARK
jgi:hypothetical protein